MLVASFKTAGLVAHFDPTTGATDHVRSVKPSETACGHYGKLAATDVALYREAGGLRLRVGEEVIRLDGSVDVQHHVVGADCVLTVGQNIELRYPAPPEWYGLKDDLTPFAEAEHFDLGLFVANVAGDPERSARIYR
ncbi:hypothetical protein [Kitasatospora sp. NPDC057541]|uniref:hypothetical protein n=1 Tax=Kitasatospora sp. NPDC057541 TaxID=3346161 RepID=UPI0036B78511